jgi:hypothetical protein
VVIGAAAALLLLLALAIGAHLLSRAVERRTANLQPATIADDRSGSAASRRATPAAPEPQSAPAATTSASAAPGAAAADAELAQRLAAEEKRVAQTQERLTEQQKRLAEKKKADEEEATKSAAAAPPQLAPAQPGPPIYFRAPSDRPAAAPALPKAAGRSAAAAPASPAGKPSTEGDAGLAPPPVAGNTPDAGAAAAPATDSLPSPLEVAPPPGGDRPRVPGAAPATAADLSGRWEITNVIHSTSYPTYRGLRLIYHLSLRQEGNRVVGEGEKWAENGQPIPANGRSPIQVTGEVVGREVRLHFTERGSRRSSDGNFHWRLAPGGQALDGNFISTAASSSGSSSAVRVP